MSVIHSCLNSNNGAYYIIATSNVKSLDLSQLQILGASNGKVTIKFLDELPPRYATKIATNSFRKNEANITNEQPTLDITSTGDSTTDLSSRMDHILTLLLDVQQRLIAVETYLSTSSSAPSPPRKTSNARSEQFPMSSSSHSQASI